MIDVALVIKCVIGNLSRKVKARQGKAVQVIHFIVESILTVVH